MKTRMTVVGLVICAVLGWAGVAAVEEVSSAEPETAAAAPSEESWNVDESRAPSKLFEYAASQGTWIGLDVSPDGKTIVFDLLGHLYRVPFEGGTAEALTNGRSWNLFPRFSPDGRRLAFTSDRGGSEDIWVMDLSDGSLENVSQMSLPVFQSTWSRDGRHLYATALNLRVRFPVYQFNLLGGKQELIPADGRDPVNHLVEHPSRDLIFFEHNDESLPRSGPRIKTYDLKSGEIEVFIERPGGAASPRVSPDGKLLAYVRRNDLATELVVRDLDTLQDRVLHSGLDWGRFESSSFYGCYSNMAWTPDNRHIVISMGGGIHAVEVETGDARKIEFTAPVRREFDETMRFKLDVPDEQARTRSHRWAQRTPDGILFEALGDLWMLTADGEHQNLTNSPAHETAPLYDSGFGRIFFAAWDDENLGTLWERPVDGEGDNIRLTETPSQYGALKLANNGQRIFYVRGDDDIRTGTHLEGQTGFELMMGISDHRRPRIEEYKLADIQWSRNRYAKRPPAVTVGVSSEDIYYSDYEDDQLVLKRLTVDMRTGSVSEPTKLYTFPRATRAVVSPDEKWIAYREYHRTWVTPFEFVGQILEISAADRKGVSFRVDADWDGDFTEWDEDSQGLHWTRGRWFCEKKLEDILAQGKPNDPRPRAESEGESGETTNGGGGSSAAGASQDAASSGSSPSTVRRTDLSMTFDIARPAEDAVTALTNVRVLTMNAGLEVLENATVLVRGDRIESVGTNVDIPSDAEIRDLSGHTIMPGMFDAHGHYGSPIGLLNVIEQRHYGLLANLAYGVTTMYDVYGTTQKDFWISDMLRAGKMTGPRIYSVGDPIFVTKYRTKMHRPIHSLEDALEHARFNRDHGALGLKDYSNHTRAARQQLAAASRELGLNLVSESFANPQMNLTQLVDGFTGLEHTMGITPLYDDVVSFFAATEVGMTPTLIVVYNGPSGERYFHMTERLWEDEKLLRFFRKEELLRLRRPTKYWEDDQYHRRMASELRKLHEKGVILTMGAHGQMMGLGAHWEMELFVHGGFTPLQAIQIATINGFRHQGLDDRLGSIEPGKLADLVVLTENPLEDIRHTRSIRYVMKNGHLYHGATAAPVTSEDPLEPEPLYFQR
ncbi:MAG TPA: amidohydrolase family protein [Acidobacteriota bacterium]|nr:amidohydrolase family protein [Acidobacteriota bacterium]